MKTTTTTSKFFFAALLVFALGYAGTAFATIDATPIDDVNVDGGGGCFGCGGFGGFGGFGFGGFGGFGGGGGGTPTVNPPQCTLTLNPTTLTWTSVYANTISIVPLTNSPAIPAPAAGPAPVVFGNTSVKTNTSFIADLTASSVVLGNSGILADQQTLNRVCSVISPGTVALTWTSRPYDSPGNNSVVYYSSGAWRKMGAGNSTRHLDSSVTCGVANASNLSGSHTFNPALGVGTHTYRLTATGIGGTRTCEATVTVPPPTNTNCRLEITKSVNKTSVAPGEELTYTLNFRNAGTADCTGDGVKVTDVVDSRLTYVGETHTSNVSAGYGADPVYKSSDRTLRFNAGTLTPGESGSVSWRATVASPQQCSENIPNTAKITSFEYGNFTQFVESNMVNTTVTKPNCVPSLVPQCAITTSATQIVTGQSVTIGWTSSNVTSGFITTIGTTSPVSAGSQLVYPPSDTTFTGTFTGPYGTTTCSVFVKVTTGGGGCQGSCGGGGLNQPNVVLFQKPTEGTLAFVSLNSIPYTGFEAGFALTIIFWGAVGMIAALATYFVVGQAGMQAVLALTLSASGVPVIQPTRRPRAQLIAHDDEDVDDEVDHDALPVTPIVTQSPVQNQTGIPELAEVIEQRAHGAGVLMSPEAVQSATELSTDRGESLKMFGEILNQAVKTIPREDGWILLTSDRFNDISALTQAPTPVATPDVTPSIESLLTSVTVPPAPVAETASTLALIQAIFTGDRDTAYQVARDLEAAGTSAVSVMTTVATQIDMEFQARRHGLTTQLTTAASALSDETLTALAEVFVHGMDGGYPNAFTSLKLAIAKGFEVRG